MTLRTGKAVSLLSIDCTPLSHAPARLTLAQGLHGIQGTLGQAPVCQLRLTAATLQVLILLDHQLCITSLLLPGPGITGQGPFL